MKVIITRNQNNYIKSGEIDATIIESPRWDDISGGCKQKNSGYALYGYIDYSIAKELVDCSGMHEFGDNSAKICIPFSLNNKKEYQEGYLYLVEHAENEKPQSKISINRPIGWKPCTKYILDMLEEHGEMTRKELREMIRSDYYSGKEGYELNTIRQALKRLQRTNRVVISSNTDYDKQIITKV